MILPFMLRLVDLFPQEVAWLIYHGFPELIRYYVVDGEGIIVWTLIWLIVGLLLGHGIGRGK